MHNTTTRLQTVFSSFTTTLTLLAALIALLSLLFTPSPTLPANSLKLHNIQTVKGRPHIYTSRKEEYAHVRFDLDVDLSSLFGWNTKMVFLYVTASYPPETFAKRKPTREVGEGEQRREEGYEGDVEDETSLDLEVVPGKGGKLNTKAIIWDAVLPHPLAPLHHNQYRYPTPSSSSTPNTNKKDAKTAKGKRKVSAAAARDLEAQAQAQHQAAARQTPGILRLAGQRPKYQITDPSGILARRANASLELSWNIQPWVGALTWGSGSASLAASSSALHSRDVRDKVGVQGVVGWLADFGVDGWVSTWRSVKGRGARSKGFVFPGLKDVRKAGQSADLKTEKGAEGHKLMVG